MNTGVGCQPGRAVGGKIAMAKIAMAVEQL
jgi:hypothetical protein